MASGICFKFESTHHAAMVDVLLVFEASLVIFLIAEVRLLKFQWQGAQVVLPSCAGLDLYTKADWERRCEVVGGHHGSRAKGPWKLVLIDFRN